MKKSKSPLSLTWGLFNIPFYRDPKEWVKDVHRYFKRRRFLLKHGYPEQMLWETYCVSQAMFKEVFTWYLNERSGDIPLSDNLDELQTQNNELYTHLIECLERMDEDSDSYREISKDKFFELMKQHWFDFWD